MNCHNHSTIEEALQCKGIRPTANRLLVARCLSELKHPASMTEIEQTIDTMDKSSVFRVLTLFVEHDIVHVIDDGSGSLKYELCRSRHGHSIDDMHVHFRCEVCGRVFCVDQPIPPIELPEGFTLLTSNFVGKGVCAECNRKAG